MADVFSVTVDHILHLSPPRILFYWPFQSSNPDYASRIIRNTLMTAMSQADIRSSSAWHNPPYETGLSMTFVDAVVMHQLIDELDELTRVDREITINIDDQLRMLIQIQFQKRTAP